MAWRDILTEDSRPQYPQNPQNSNCGYCEDIGVEDKKSYFPSSSTDDKEQKLNSESSPHNPHNPQNPTTAAELNRVCRRAVAEYPNVSAEQLRRFLEVAQDPAWTTERVARHLARRMSEDLL